MFLDNLAGQYTKKEIDNSFTELEINKNAVKDFKYLCSQMNLTCRDALGYTRVGHVKDIGDFLVVGVDTSTKVANVPSELVNVTNETQYVAFVLYNGENVQDVYVIKSTLFGEKQGFFSAIKNNSKKGIIQIKFGKLDKLEQYKFGHVLKEYI